MIQIVPGQKSIPVPIPPDKNNQASKKVGGIIADAILFAILICLFTSYPLTVLVIKITTSGDIGLGALSVFPIIAFSEFIFLTIATVVILLFSIGARKAVVTLFKTIGILIAFFTLIYIITFFSK